jgi:UDP-N-acetylglucosamine 3-dehydrogenase
MARRRTGVVGCGWFGRAHCRVYHEISELTAVCDLDEGKAREVAEQYGVNWYTDCGKLLEEGVEAVSVVVPPTQIAGVAEIFASRGVDVLAEKPLGPRLEDVERLLTYGDSVRIMPGFIELFSPAYRTLKEHLGEGGDPIMVSTRRIGRFPRSFWKIGVVMDLAFHDLYLLRDLLGRVDVKGSLLGYTFNERYEDSAVLLVEAEKGVKGVIEANWLTPTKERRLRIYGSQGVSEADFVTQEVTISKREEGGGIREVRLRLYTQEEPLRNELKSFLYDEEPPITIRDGIETLKLALKALSKGV